ncbi:hypothetical protein [Peribacillus deserti]|uniref:hypothetical protein n=1 Tax=Peribacillus deserti TaxID=673318 RepID=UPI0015E0E616|nr:hypothetical protein [Peribacillus deserti]
MYLLYSPGTLPLGQYGLGFASLVFSGFLASIKGEVPRSEEEYQDTDLPWFLYV